MLAALDKMRLELRRGTSKSGMCALAYTSDVHALQITNAASALVAFQG